MDVKVNSDCPLGMTAKYPWDKEDKPVKAFDTTCQYICPHYGGAKDGTVICNIKRIIISKK